MAAWQVFDTSSMVLCRSILVAVANGHRRRGYGRRLKEEMKKEARAAGAVAISSVVDRRNHAMIQLNRSVGTVIERVHETPITCHA